MPFGPVQLLVVGFARPDFCTEVLAEFERLRESESDEVRVLDVLVVHKDADGVVERVQRADLAAGRGRRHGRSGRDVARARNPARHPPPPLLPADDEFCSIDDAILNDSDAVIVLVEHRWAIGTREAIRSAGGKPGRRRVD